MDLPHLTPENQDEEQTLAQVITAHYQENPVFISDKGGEIKFVTLEEAIEICELHASHGQPLHVLLGILDTMHAKALAIEQMSETNPEAAARYEALQQNSGSGVAKYVLSLKE